MAAGRAAVESAGLAKRPARRGRMVVEKGFVLSVRVTDELKDRIDRAAKRAALTMPDWTRAVLARAVNEGAFAPRKGGPYGRKRKRTD